MRRMFEIPYNIDELLKDVHDYNPQIAEDSQCSKKFANNGFGISPLKKKQIDAVVKNIKLNRYQNCDENTKLKLITLLTLYANYIDQQTFDTMNDKLPEKELKETVVDWLGTAYTIAQQVLPNLNNGHLDASALSQCKPQILSHVSLLYHYFGRAQRYDSKYSVDDRFTLLNTALLMANHLAQLRRKQDIIDPHYYPSRSATFQLRVGRALLEKGDIDAAEHILLKYNANSEHTTFNKILAYVFLTTLSIRKQKPNDAMDYAGTALQIIEASAQENFKSHWLNFEAQIAAMDAYAAAGEHYMALRFAKDIIDAWDKNPNCGAKTWHIKTAEEYIKATEEKKAVSSSF